MLKPPRARQGFVSEQDFRKLFGHLPKHLQPLILFLYRCGGRLGEARELKWKQIDLANAVVSFYPEQTKTDEARTVPLPDELVTLLKRIKPKYRADEQTVFDSMSLRSEWAVACVKAGLGKFVLTSDNTHKRRRRYEGLTIHDLRRSALNNLRKMNVPQAVAMRFSGHKTTSTFLRYNIVDLDEMRSALQKVENTVKSKSEKALPSKPARKRLPAAAVVGEN